MAVDSGLAGKRDRLVDARGVDLPAGMFGNTRGISDDRTNMFSQNGGRLVNIRVGNVVVESEWNDSETAKLIAAALPIEASGNYWGGEIYFEIPVSAGAAPDARDEVEPGTVAFWPAGNCLYVFWGPTPASRGGECRAASDVNVVGRVQNPEVLPKLKSRIVRVETPDCT